MALPASVKVGAWEYTIEAWATREASRDDRWASADHSEHIIRVDTGWGEKRTAVSLLHEILHCVWRQWGIVKGDEEERTILALERGLAAVWHDNPEVMRWIGKGLAS